MRILIAGSDKVFAIENIYVKYLREAGNTVYHFPSRSIFFDYYQRSYLNKLLFRLGISGIHHRINKQLKESILQFEPDVIWVFKGMEIFPDTLRWAGRRGIKLVNYNADNPFIFMGKGSGNKNLTNSLSIYDLHFTYNPSVKERIQKKFRLKTVLLPFGFDIDEPMLERCAMHTELCEVCFLGNADGNRAEFIRALSENNIRISLYGKDWGKFINHPLVTINGSVHGEELWQVLRKYRVQLNLIRIHNEDSHNMRTFEVPAVGGIMLAPNTSDHRKYFEDGREVILFNGIKDCVEKIKQILALPKGKADEIRVAARKRSLHSKYSYRDRTEQVINELEKL